MTACHMHHGIQDNIHSRVLSNEMVCQVSSGWPTFYHTRSLPCVPADAGVSCCWLCWPRCCSSSWVLEMKLSRLVPGVNIFTLLFQKCSDTGTSDLLHTP